MVFLPRPLMEGNAYITREKMGQLWQQKWRKEADRNKLLDEIKNIWQRSRGTQILKESSNSLLSLEAN